MVKKGWRACMLLKGIIRTRYSKVMAFMLAMLIIASLSVSTLVSSAASKNRLKIKDEWVTYLSGIPKAGWIKGTVYDKVIWYLKYPNYGGRLPRSYPKGLRTSVKLDATECVDFVKVLSGWRGCASDVWRPSVKKVVENGVTRYEQKSVMEFREDQISRGTVIATFTGVHYDGHTAVFIKFVWDANGKKIGFYVWDQNWARDGTVAKHFISINGKTRLSIAYNYRIVRVPS